MNLFENVKFNMVKENLTDEILKNIYRMMEFYKNIFLTDRLRFNSVLDFHTDISFFDEHNTFHINKRMNYKPLTIEDFLYRSLDEIAFEIKVYLKQTLNEMEEKLHLNFYKFDIIHTTGLNCTSKENYFKQ